MKISSFFIISAVNAVDENDTVSILICSKHIKWVTFNRLVTTNCQVNWKSLYFLNIYHNILEKNLQKHIINMSIDVAINNKLL